MHRSLRVILFSLLSLLLLLLGGLVLLATTGWGQRVVTQQVNRYLAQKIRSPFRIGRIEYRLPDWVALNDVYFITPKGDTLVSGKRLYVNLDMLALLRNRIAINELELERVRLNLNRTLPDTTFNFQYLIDAFDTGAPPKPADTAAAPLDFNLAALRLKDVRVRYKDDVVGAETSVFLDSLSARFDTINPVRSRYHLADLRADGLTALVRLYEGIPQPASAPSADTLDLRLGNWQLSRVAWNVRSESFRTEGKVGRLRAETEFFYLNGQRVGIKSVELSRSDIAATLEKVVRKSIPPAKTAAPTTPDPGWEVNVGQARLADNRIRYDDQNAARQGRGLDYNHLDISGLSLDGKALSYRPDRITASLRNGRFREKNGFTLQRLDVDAVYTDTLAVLNRLYVQTPGSLLRDRLSLRYPSLDALSRLDDPRVAKDVHLILNLRQSRLAMADLLQLAPFLATAPPLNNLQTAVVQADIRASGTLASLNVPVFTLTTLTNTRLRMEGRLQNVASPERLVMNLNLDEFSTNRADLQRLLPARTLPDSVSLAPRLSLTGNLDGGLNDLRLDARLRTDWGNAAFDGRLRNFLTGRGQAYAGQATLDGFETGRWLGRPDQIGRISATASVDGQGLDLRTARARFQLNVREASLNGYRYRGAAVQGSLAEGILALAGDVDDPNARVALDTRVGLLTDYPSVQGTVDIRRLDLQKRNFYKEPLALEGRLRMDFASTDPLRPEGELVAREAIVDYQGKTYPIDSLYLLARTNAEEKVLQAGLPFGRVSITGNYAYTRLYDLLAGEVNRYFAVPELSYKPVEPPYYANVEARLHDDPLLRAFVPALTRLDTVKLEMHLDNRLDTTLYATIQTGLIEYDTNQVRGSEFRLLAVNNQLRLAGVVNSARVQSYTIGRTEITGLAESNTLDFAVVSKDSADRSRHGLVGKLELRDGNYLARLKADGLLTNYRYWESDTNGYLQYGKAGILARTFVLRSRGEQLTVNSEEPVPNAPLRVTASRLDLAGLAQLAGQDTSLVSGTLNGDIVLRDVLTELTFTGNLTVDSLRVMSKPIGALTARFRDIPPGSRRIGVEAELAGPYNQARVTGFYNPTTPAQALDFRIDLQRIDARTVEAFSFGELRQARGELRGQFTATGSTSAPRLNGQLSFDSVSVNIAQLNATYRIVQETIQLNDKVISFRDFALQDTLGRTLTTNGTVTIRELPDLAYDLRVRADNFLVLNAARKDNDYVYGQASVTANLRIRGSGTQPAVDGTIRVEDRSEVTVVLPDDSPSVNEARQTVTFIDHRDSLALRKYLVRPKRDSTQRRIAFEELRNAAINLNIEVNEKSEFTIIIDELNGDNLRARGNAQLTLGMTSSGAISLLGRYEVTEGEYALTYEVLKRQFSIQKGSSIVWTGDPLRAQIDLTAIYQTDAAPADLVANESSQQLAVGFRQKIPFNVALKMNGNLSAPQISFDITVPERSFIADQQVVTTVKDKLAILRQNPSELNKQVFALLVLNGFIAENSSNFFSGSGGGRPESIALNSVSKVLSDQLERFASSLLKGFDVDFNLLSSDVYSQRRTGQRTDFNVGLSRSFLEWRLTVTVGRNFVLQNNTGLARNPSEVFDNVSLNYNLTRDGRYVVRAYRNNAYQDQAVVDGYVVETGLAFVIAVDYNLLNQLFRKKAEEEVVQ